MPVGSTSRLGRLFTYSKDTALVAQENFTTEALRMVIEDDPWPLVEALCRLDRARAEACSLREFRGVRVRSQVSLPRGWLDLVIELVNGDGDMTNEVWVEVKIGAPESGGQLAHYRGLAEGRLPHPWLITLANEAPHSDVPNLSWNVLYQCARHGRQESRSWAQHPSWEDLGRFLEEQNVTRDELAPITDTEAGSLEVGGTDRVMEI